MNHKIVIGSRESRLAVIQSEMVRDFLKQNHPELEVEILTMKTTGDIILDRTLDKVGGKGLFVKELDKALADKRSDLSVHSLKDMPMEVSEELPILAFSKREDPRDVLILPKGVTEYDSKKPIGCSSLRRILQLRELFPQAQCKSVRGNIQTRLAKLDAGEYGALVLAAAGIKRLGLEERIHRYFSVDEILPAAGQGVLAVQGRKGEDTSWLAGYEDEDTKWAVLGERAFVRYLDGGCSSPVAAHGTVSDKILTLKGLYYCEATGEYKKGEISGPVQDAERLGRTLAADLERKINKGKVWLVGAGPGDVGLFTLKGKAVLEEAQVVVYDSLVGHGVLALVPKSARCINVGKRANRHTMPQEQINQVLLEEARKGYRVVRLKGGDPFLFGRGGEELELLKQYHIPYEIVPGVTSPIAVPAYNGIPVTHRDFCSSVHIITGHKKAGAEYDIDFKALVDTKGTLVFLMGVSALEDICVNLMQAGMDKDMPAAILQKGTTAGQKRIVATVSTLKQEVDRQGIETPAIIVVGKVCALAEEFAWREELPLQGWKVLLTRPRDLISEMARKLRKKGAEVIELPAIATNPLEDQSRLYEVMENLSCYHWLVFTSPTGVKVFFREMKNARKDIRSLGNAKIAAIGEGTKKQLEDRGLYVDLIPPVYDGDCLGESLAKQCKGDEKILIPRAEKGNENLTMILKEKGCQVDDIATYRTSYETSRLIDEKKLFDAEEIDCVVFTSASTVKGFAESTKGIDYTKIKAACIGKQTKACADAYGMQTCMADKATMDSLTELVVKMKRREETWN